ncbi:replication initiator [Streptacidiphilus sp. MAP5-3]|uniref:replication initiator n=1 Tax=unclassified Streptacidiphilus TaxID=2643834 RepID=UPI003516D52C
MNLNPFESPAARRAYLDHLDRIKQLSPVDRDLVRLGQMPGLERWLGQITATGGCAHPIYLSGHTTRYDRATGEVLSHYSTRDEPGERLAVRCRNRRAASCPSCSWQYQGDAFHLVRAGLAGGKGIPATVRHHPRAFVTLTAPSFGKVHRSGQCHPIRAKACPHGSDGGCGQIHDDADPLVGQALCAHCYDYVGHVLWNAHAGVLWKAFRDNLYHHIGVRSGVGRSAVRRVLRVSAAKVAEYQRRGMVHFHAVIRLDGPTGSDSPPPDWATVELLLDTIRTAAAAVALPVPASAAYGERRLTFGRELDAHSLTGGEGEQMTDDHVAAYVAKYTTKGVEATGVLDRRIDAAGQIRRLKATRHVRALVGTCWRLGALPELERLRLRACAHMLGYRGHCLSKTYRYSTTFGALRAERAAYLTGRTGMQEEAVGVDAAWRYVGRGYTPGEAELAAGIAESIVRNRQIGRAALADLEADEAHRGRRTARQLEPGWAGGARRAAAGTDHDHPDGRSDGGGRDAG